jgi:hypothetical protein
MKKIILFLVAASSFVACTTQSSETGKQPIGFDMASGAGRTALYGGDTSNVAVFENYIKALNDRDTATLRSLEASDSLKIYIPSGEVLTSGDKYISFMANYFTSMNPKWTLNFSLANTYTDKEGKLHEWVTSSGTVTHTVDGKVTKVNRYFDANIVKGKIQKMYVTERALSEGE